MEFSRYHPKTIPKVTTLLRDFECEVLPNAVKSTYVGHSQNVKFVTFVGTDGELLASGSVTLQLSFGLPSCRRHSRKVVKRRRTSPRARFAASGQGTCSATRPEFGILQQVRQVNVFIQARAMVL